MYCSFTLHVNGFSMQSFMLVWSWGRGLEMENPFGQFLQKRWPVWSLSVVQVYMYDIRNVEGEAEKEERERRKLWMNKGKRGRTFFC